MKFGPIEPGDTATLASLVTPDAHATRQLYDLECVGKTTDGREGKRYASLSIVPSPYVNWNYDNDGNLRVTLRELTGKAAMASVTLAVPPDSGVTNGISTQTVTMQAGGILQVVCPLQGREKQSAPCVMRLSVTANGVAQSLPVRLIPFLANGSFESTAGDGQPDFWQAIDYSGKVDEAELMPRVHLDDQVVYDGKYSLRIDPYIGKVKGFKGVSVYPSSFKLLYNHKYRVTGQLRIPDDGSAYLIAGQDWQFTKPVGVRDNNGWQKFERTFTTGNPQWGFALSIGNTGPTPVWFDAITVAEVKE